MNQIKSDEYRQAFLAVLPPTELTPGGFLGLQQPHPTPSETPEAEVDAIDHKHSIETTADLAIATPTDEPIGQQPAMDIMLTNLTDPHSLMPHNLPSSSSSFSLVSNSVFTLRDIIDRTHRIYSGVIQEATRLPNHEDRLQMADKIDQLCEEMQSTAVLLRMEGYPRGPAFTTATFSSSAAFNEPSIGAHSSALTRREMSTQTGSLSIPNLVDRAKSDDAHQHHMLEDIPPPAIEPTPENRPPLASSDSRNDAMGPGVLFSHDSPFEVERFLEQFDSYKDSEFWNRCET